MEKCMSVVNNSLIKHNLLLGVDDRGKISCHKVNLCFIYFEPNDCIVSNNLDMQIHWRLELVWNCFFLQKRLETVLAEKPEENGSVPSFDRESYLRDVEQFEDIEVVVTGRSSSLRIARGQERAERLFLHYIQRWAKDYLRRRLDWVIEDLYGRSEYASNTSPRHLRTALCPCQVRVCCSCHDKLCINQIPFSTSRNIWGTSGKENHSIRVLWIVIHVIGANNKW